MNEKNQKIKRPTLQTVLMMVFSLLCALLIWVYVTEANGPDITQTFNNVAVVFDGESVMRDSRGLIVSEKNNNSVRVVLSGNRRVIASLDAADLAVSIDLNSISLTGDYSRTPRIVYPSRVDASQISSATTVPGNISFYVDKLSTRAIPVVGIFNGAAAEGFTAEPLEFDTETVRISGPENILSQVDHALVEVSRTDVDKTLSFETSYVLVNSEGETFESDQISFDRDTVNVTLPISAVKEVDLVVDLIPGGGAMAEHAKVEVQPERITLVGDSETLAGVNNISLAKIDLSKLDSTLTETYRIVIPNDTHSTEGVKEATVTVTLEGLSRKTVTIEKSNISFINNSEGFEAEIMNSSLENVIIRGPAEVLADISDVNVRAVADLKDYGTATGFMTVPVRIEVDGTTEAGAFGDYRVYVNITASRR